MKDQTMNQSNIRTTQHKRQKRMEIFGNKGQGNQSDSDKRSQFQPE